MTRERGSGQKESVFSVGLVSRDSRFEEGEGHEDVDGVLKHLMHHEHAGTGSIGEESACARDVTGDVCNGYVQGRLVS